jgi:hypothetical protein
MRQHKNSQQMSDGRKAASKRGHLKQRMAADWIKLHQPEVWDAIVEWVGEQHPS